MDAAVIDNIRRALREIITEARDESIKEDVFARAQSQRDYDYWRGINGSRGK